MISSQSLLIKLKSPISSMTPNLTEKMNTQYLVGLNGITSQILDLGTFFSELHKLDLNKLKTLASQEIELFALGRDQDSTTSPHSLATKKTHATIT